MGLKTDIIFAMALQSDTRLLAKLPAGDVYNTSIALPDEDLDNADVPYIIVTFDGLTNDQSTKDEYEGDTDTVQVGIEVTAKTRKQLSDLTEQVRRTVRRYFTDADEDDEFFPLIPHDYQFSASPVNYDPLKPCYWQRLNYQCDMDNDTTEDEDENEDE